jgi:hypothetical protein
MELAPERLGELGAASVRGALDKLLAGRLALAAKHDEPSPLVTLHVRGVGALHGRLIGETTDDRGAALLLQMCDYGQREPRDDVAFVDPTAVTAVQLHGAEAWARSLARLKPLTSIELQRRMKDAGAKVGAAVGHAIEVTSTWRGLGGGGDAAAAFAALIDAARDAVVALAKDDLGKQSLAQVKTIELTDGAQPGVANTKGKGLVFTAPLGAPDAERIVASHPWPRALEDVL